MNIYTYVLYILYTIIMIIIIIFIYKSSLFYQPKCHETTRWSPNITEELGPRVSGLGGECERMVLRFLRGLQARTVIFWQRTEALYLFRKQCMS